ncbi:MAG: hypothetical protein ACYTAN_18795 [Planctomycetota bacterium]|jgi:hypothetical protein
MSLRLSNSGWFWGASATAGVAITYGLAIETDPVEVFLGGAFWGVVVGASLAALIDSLLNFSEYKWHALGWILVATAYAFWVVFYYEGDPDISLREAVYWRIGACSLAAFLLGWLFLGSFLAVKLGRK